MNNRTMQLIVNQFVYDLLGSLDDVVLLPLYADSNPNKRKILCSFSLNFGDVDVGELGERGVSPRSSIIIITFSANNMSQYPRMLELTDMVETAFRRKDIQGILCEEPYTQNIGVTKDERIALFVTIPVNTWTCN